jgi:hypothetical protein
VHVGLLDFDEVQAHGRVELDRADLGALAHDLLVDLALGRNVDDDSAEGLGLAGKRAPGDQAAFVVIAPLDRREGG